MPGVNDPVANINQPVIESWATNPRLVSGRSNKNVQIQPFTTAQQGLPKPVSQLTATSSVSTVGGARMATVQINHKVQTSDAAFHHANVWVTGLAGNPNPQLQSASTASPHTLLLPSTGENVSVTVQSVGKDGSLLPLSKSPSTQVKL